MAKYKVKVYKGDYFERQNQANIDRAICYIEQHFNSSANPGASYAVTITGRNASKTSIEWAKWYAQAIDAEFKEVDKVAGDQGALVGGFGGRGDGNICKTKMPAILLEPLFCNNPSHAAIMTSEEGQKRLAKVLVESIKRFFPNGGLVAFSIGHKYKRSSPNDRGAVVAGFAGFTEADCAEKVLTYAQAMLES